jgi:hypothetical protein
MLYPIDHFNKVDLLKALWIHAKLSVDLNALFRGESCIPPSPPFDTFMAPKAIKSPIWTFSGYYIGCDLSGSSVNASAFDQMYGRGAFARVTHSLETC